MTKKKRGHPDAEEVLSRPWCYYCERDFDDLKILINHQKAKHFKCERCGRRLNTAGGLSVHMSQVHKENLTAVDNALPNRAGLDIEIFGMEGIPEDIANQHYQRVLTTFHQAEADRRANTGNPASGAAGGNAAKKPKFESPSDLKKRLAEHKAKLAAEQANGGGSGGGTPVGAGQISSQPQETITASPQFQQYQKPYSAPPPPASLSFSQPSQYAQSPVQASPFQQQSPAGYAPQPSFSPQPYQGQAPYQNQAPFPAQPSYQNQSPYPPQPPFQAQLPYQNQQPPYQNQAPFPSQPPFQNQPPYQNQSYQGQPPYQPQPQPYQNQPFQPLAMQNGHPHFQGPPGGPPRPYGAGSPTQPYPQSFQPQRTHTPPQNGSFPQRTGSGSLPAAPGLPQRPAFGAPQVNAQDFHRMHQGQNSNPQNAAASQNGLHSNYQQAPQAQPYQTQPQFTATPPGLSEDSAQATSLDDLISSASKQADTAAAPPVAQPSEPAVAPVEPAPVKEESTEDKSAKKEKEKEKPKTTKMIYSDNDISPEEKMASMPRYAYTPEKKFMV